jgi:hypothetical protein
LNQAPGKVIDSSAIITEANTIIGFKQTAQSDRGLMQTAVNNLTNIKNGVGFGGCPYTM